MELRLLGPVELDGPEGPVPISAPKERALLAYLGLHANETLSEDALVDALWADDPPRTATRTLQAYLSRLRKALSSAGAELVLESRPGGWALHVDPEALDVARVQQLVLAARTATDAGDRMGAALTLAEAQRCWRGRALAEFVDSPWALAGSVRLEELRLHVVEERIEAELACGRHDALAGELEALCAMHPLRERLWGQRMVALYRAGRQADALRVHQGLRDTLRDELGIDPSPKLVQLEQRILQQDPSLEAPAPPVGADGAPTDPAPAPRAPLARSLPAAFESLREAGFVGRTDELDALGQAWERARAGSLEVVLLAGEPGIGKTTLAVQQAAAAWTDGAIVLFGRCDEENLAPFQPFVEALGHYADTTPAATLRAQLLPHAEDLALLVPLGRVLPELVDVVPTGAETERYRMFEAVPAALRVIASDAPVLLVLDDLHWADRPTLQLLQHVIRRSGGTSLLILGTYRDTDLVRTHPMAEALGDMRRANLISRVSLRGLTREDVVSLLQGDAPPDPVDHSLAEALWTETEGSPLFLREILRHLAETGVVARDEAGRWRAQRRLDQLGIPEGLREVIGRRLTRLSEDTNTMLRAGSVLGREVRFDVLERLTDLDDDRLLDALDEAAAAGVIAEVPGAVGRYAFTHALVRHALYDELSITRRVRLHQAVGQALEAIHGRQPGAHLAELAFHFSQSAVAGDAEKAVMYAREAAEHARSLVAYEDAVRHYGIALEVAEDAALDASTRADLLAAMGDCHWAAGDARGAREVFTRAHELVPGDAERQARTALGFAGAGVRGMWVEIAFANEHTLRLLEQALAQLDEGDSDLRARLLACLAQELTYVDESDDRRAALTREAIEMARRLGDPATLAVVLSASNLASYSAHSAAERAERALEALELGVALGDRRIESHGLFHRYSALAECGRVREAHVVLERATAVYDEIKDPVGRMLCAAFIGGAALLEGRFDEAQGWFNQSFDVAQETKDRNGFIVFAGGMSTLRYYQGRSVEMMGLVDDGEASFPAFGRNIAAMHGAMLAEMGHLDLAREELAAAGIDGPGALRHDPFWSFCMYLLARGVMHLRDEERAAWLYDELAPFADHTAGIGLVAWGPVHLALGWCATTLGRADVAEAHYEATIAACADRGWVVPSAEAQYWLALLLSERGGPGDDERAIELLEAAVTVATEVGLGDIVRNGPPLRDHLLGREPATDDAPSTPTRTRRDRARARLSTRGRAVVARWTRGDSDDDLVRRFGHDLAQRALFGGMVKAYQPSVSYGFSGDIVFELRPPPHGLDPAGGDWWTIEVRRRKATARRGRSDEPAVTISVGLADFVRLSAGELHPLTAMVDGQLEVSGDIILAMRLGEMFGAVEPLDDLSRTADGA